MPEIVLTTLNARYAHASFGLRYLMANLGDLQPRAELLEFDISQRASDVAEQILARSPRIVGIGVYIWNAELSEQVVAIVKRVRPDLLVVVGGPEVSYETDRQPICTIADFVITGEADLAFAELCARLLSGQRPLMKVIPADLPEFRPAASAAASRQRAADSAARTTDRPKSPLPIAQRPSPSNPPAELRDPHVLCLPYALYSAEDIAHRVIYVEASRGCPFKCEFCLSSLDVPVRNVPLDAFLHQMQSLLDRGVRQFKFVDRTFNLNLSIGRSILQFFLDRLESPVGGGQGGLFLHFEMIPDRLPDGLRELIERFPPGALQFEVGIQTFNETVAERISRRQDNAKVEANLRYLRERTGVHVHADLIVGLPGEDIESFAAGFDRLLALGPQEIQVGILKRLRGTPIARHDEAWGMVYSPHPPYEVLKTSVMPFETLQRLRRFARYWDLVGNSGNFVETTRLLCRGDSGAASPSAFQAFLRFSDWLHEHTGRRTHGIALHKLAELIFDYLAPMAGQSAQDVGQTIARDFARAGREVPDFVRPHVPDLPRPSRTQRTAPARQAKHLGVADGV